MSSECAIIIAALITVGGSVLTFGLNLFFNKSVNKNIAEEKFFYSVFEKRLELYNSFCLWIKEIPNDIIKFLNSNPEDQPGLLEIFEQKNDNALVSIQLRAKLLGDYVFAEKCYELNDSFLKEIYNQLGYSDSSMFEKVSAVTSICTNKAYDFIHDFSEESFPSFLDSFIERYVNSTIPEFKRRAKMDKKDEERAGNEADKKA